jgi:digeranylgeranylglycerophospholipid reductase
MFTTADKLRRSYDCAIVGAGPAGLNAARRLLQLCPGITGVLIDRGSPWERPKPCAEGVGRLGFEEAVPVARAWIRHEVARATFHSPSDIPVNYSDKNGGYILDRARMQRDLAAGCVAGGMDCVLDHGVSAVSLMENGVRVLRLQGGTEIAARVVIDASGASSPLGKREGITWKAYDAEPAYFAIAENVEHDNDAIHVFVGRKIAPGGYAWMFPSEGDLANIGVLIGTQYRGKVNIRQLLSSFIKARFPAARIQSYHAGTMACGYRRCPIAIPGLVKAGDAASTTNPMSRAGIVEAMKSGLLAAECAAGMLGANNTKTMVRLCEQYERNWFKGLGKRHQKLLETKGSLQGVPDKDYDTAARSMTGIPAGRMTMARIFRTALSRFPRLVRAMRHLM